MRVLLGIDTWGLVGGTERYASDVAGALRARGHDVAVLCRDVGAGACAAAPSDVPVVQDAAFGDPSAGRGALRELARRVRRERPDVVFLQIARGSKLVDALLDAAPLVRFVHDHTLFCPGLNKVRADGELCDRPLGLECLSRYWLAGGCVCFQRAGHANALVEPLRALGAKLAEIEANRRAARIVTNSRYMRGELLQAGFGADQVVALPMFTRSGSADQPPGPLGADVERFLARSDAPLLFTPARLTLPDKGVDVLLLALARLRSPARTVIAGTGPAEQSLRAAARALGLEERVLFTGWLDQGGIETLYERADVVACPSTWNEPFGLVGIEAMAHARAVVAFRVGGIPEWLAHEETGLAVERGDVRGYAAALERLLGDRQLRERMGAAGRAALAARFTREAHADALEDVLRAAAGIPAAR